MIKYGRTTGTEGERDRERGEVLFITKKITVALTSSTSRE